MSPEAALTQTVGFTAARIDQVEAADRLEPWIVIGGVLMAQQAAAIALRAAGDSIPAQAGATELLLRAASKDRLPAPFTLPFGSAARQEFERLVEARNSFMHPRALAWFVSANTLSRALPIASRAVRHMILTQPILTDLVSPAQQREIDHALSAIEAFAEFLDDSAY
ncbi:MAG: hypothetical protein AAGA72_14450 [Pseudomonadota bacterium]